MIAANTRTEAEKALRTKLGDGFPIFLRTVQPEFGKTGQEILEEIPHLILKRMIEIEQETREPLVIETLVSQDSRRGKEQAV